MQQLTLFPTDPVRYCPACKRALVKDVHTSRTLIPDGDVYRQAEERVVHTTYACGCARYRGRILTECDTLKEGK